MWLADYFLIPIAVMGHLALWIAAFNRLHASPLSRRVISVVEKPVIVATVAIPVVYAVWRAPRWPTLAARDWSLPVDLPILTYVAICLIAAAWVSVRWLARHFDNSPQRVLRSNHTSTFNIARIISSRPVAGVVARTFARLPGNQILRLDVNEKTLVCPRLPAALDGLTITHLSDLHFTGHVTKAFFQFAIERANELDSDLVVVTGDIVDKDHCIDWIPDTLGRLRGRLGVYYVLGNHDKRIHDVARLRRVLVDAGLIGVAGQPIEIDVRGQPILLAGNELPWFGERRRLDRQLAEFDSTASYRVLLSHSPDQIGWARDLQFDLMLAGHTHGGQIRLPGVGPIVSPSKFGVKYASGVFHEPPTTMHVSRGLSGLDPIRINCPPELTKLILTRE